MNVTETITWIIDGTLPDDEATVLAHTESGVVSEGFHVENHWFWVSGGSVDENVTAWADIPVGPGVKKTRGGIRP